MTMSFILTWFYIEAKSFKEAIHGATLQSGRPNYGLPHRANALLAMAGSSLGRLDRDALTTAAGGGLVGIVEGEAR